MNRPAQTPIALNRTNRCLITPRWFVDDSEYYPLLGGFRLLINGEDTFRAVHRALAAAQRSVCILCWGFQPSMYLIRDGASPRLGDLLEQRAQAGVNVRLLSWAGRLDGIGISTTGLLGEPNAPGAQGGSRPATSTPEAHAYDTLWHHRHDPRLAAYGAALRRADRRHGIAGYEPPSGNLVFAVHGFSGDDRARLAAQDYADAGVRGPTRWMLSQFPSHHQKLLLVDHEDAERCVGFVMGHNLLDEYWDTDAHSARRSMIQRRQPEREPHRHANGALPRHDVSARVTGPIVGDLFGNFAAAWQRATGEALARPNFTHYPIHPRAATPASPPASPPAATSAATPASPPAAPLPRDPVIMGQILRTQPQYGVKDIQRGYLQAVNNATQYIYLENQYFRWPPLAEQIKAAAAAQNAWGRRPEAHGTLYLFVVTNAGDAGVGAGTVNTYRMLDSLGRADAIPGVARAERLEDAQAERARARQEIAGERAVRQGLRTSLTRARNAPEQRRTQQRIEASQARQRDAEARAAEFQAKCDALADPDAAIPREEIPGLKVHVATLVAPDTPAGQPWVEVYIHSKLMLVDDAFMTLGSANLNTRSMETDSELNIAHHRPEITRPVRERLWRAHTGQRSGGEAMNKEGMEAAYKAWKDLMGENSDLRKENRPPKAPLAEFLRTSAKRSNLD